MANRHLARSIAMQSLFEWDFGGGKNEDIEKIIKYNVQEFAPGLEEKTSPSTKILLAAPQETLSIISPVMDRRASPLSLAMAWSKTALRDSVRYAELANK